ncbi:Alpha/beta knot methyltransferase [Phytophthora cactorum]|nr:Alpha/beta knot methyltransferase [Phytophthora cactorum]
MSSGDTTMRPRALEASGDGATAPYQSHRAGIQHVWLIAANDQQLKTHPDKRNKRNKKTSGKKITKNCAAENEMTIWATDLSPQAEPLVASNKPNELPARLAIVIGRETMDAPTRVFALFGFSESLNLSVATALVLQDSGLVPREKQKFREMAPSAGEQPDSSSSGRAVDVGRVPIRPLDDLRREKHEAWVPKSVRRRERKMPEVRERLGKRKQPESEPADKKE